MVLDGVEEVPEGPGLRLRECLGPVVGLQTHESGPGLGIEESAAGPGVVKVPVEVDPGAHGQDEAEAAGAGPVLPPEPVRRVAVLVSATEYGAD